MGCGYNAFVVRYRLTTTCRDETVNRMQGYIQLDRKFVEFDERLQAGESDDSLFAFDLPSKIGKSWSDILKNRLHRYSGRSRFWKNYGATCPDGAAS